MYAVRRTIRAGQARCGCAGIHGDALLLLADFLHRQAHGGVKQFGNHVDFLRVVPFARFVGCDVRFVLMVGADQFDWLTQYFAARIFDRHFRGDDSALATHIGVETRHVGQNTNLDDVVRYL